MLGAIEPTPGAPPVLGIHFELDGAAHAFFSVVSTIGTPVDVTAQEIRLKAFFPADEATRQNWATRQ